jgi:probable F420-dependent oxidoreductase
MQIGFHLPQFGRAAAPGSTERVAQALESLGYDDMWVSDHLVVPSEQPYPPAFLCDPLQTLAFAAAATERIGLGTSVLVVPQYTSVLALANTLATLDFMSSGRLKLGVGIGWSAREYEALGASFGQRGVRLEEMIDTLRTVWSTDPSTYSGTFHHFEDIRVLPKPGHPIPIWIGGTSDVALRRAAAIGNGFHGIDVPAEDTKRITDRLDELGRGDDFVFSMRLTCVMDASGAEMEDRIGAYAAAGVDHVVLVPQGGDEAAWTAVAERWAPA